MTLTTHWNKSFVSLFRNKKLYYALVLWFFDDMGKFVLWKWKNGLLLLESWYINSNPVLKKKKKSQFRLKDTMEQSKNMQKTKVEKTSSSELSKKVKFGNIKRFLKEDVGRTFQTEHLIDHLVSTSSVVSKLNQICMFQEVCLTYLHLLSPGPLGKL